MFKVHMSICAGALLSHYGHFSSVYLLAVVVISVWGSDGGSRWILHESIERTTGVWCVNREGGGGGEGGGKEERSNRWKEGQRRKGWVGWVEWGMYLRRCPAHPPHQFAVVFSLCTWAAGQHSSSDSGKTWCRGHLCLCISRSLFLTVLTLRL